jgi:hypothetical protein
MVWEYYCIIFWGGGGERRKRGIGGNREKQGCVQTSAELRKVGAYHRIVVPVVSGLLVMASVHGPYSLHPGNLRSGQSLQAAVVVDRTKMSSLTRHRSRKRSLRPLPAPDSSLFTLAFFSLALITLLILLSYTTTPRPPAISWATPAHSPAAPDAVTDLRIFIPSSPRQAGFLSRHSAIPPPLPPRLTA